MSQWAIMEGDVLDRLRGMPEESAHCVVTSPPYWGLRDYGVEGQLGLEPTPQLYVERMVEVFREVRRVLRKDGTLWLNMGDCYAAAGAGARDPERWPKQSRNDHRIEHSRKHSGLKPKDLVGMPWRLAFALQADGWWLRCDIVWSKPNPMPESVRDRPTRAHEYVFLMSKAARYYYDAEAIRQPLRPKTFTTFGTKHRPQGNDALGKVKSDNWGSSIEERQPKRNADGSIAGANKRSVWEIATQPYPEAHFATFPEKLVEPCIRAGTGEEGCCPMCGAAFVRIVEVRGGTIGNSWHDHGDDKGAGMSQYKPEFQKGGVGKARDGDGQAYERVDLGWKPGCECPIWKAEVHQDPEMPDEYEPADFPIPCTVLDPFCGSGTTGAVALRLGRSFVGIELNPEYCKLARRRIGQAAPLFAKEDPR